ncbi:MAG: LTA synthase family protein, partial [Nitrospiraceae bacterium]
MTAPCNTVSAVVVADEQPPGGSSWSFPRMLLFWWGLYLVIQQAGRLFLLPEAFSIETPSAGVLATMLVTGLRADLITATLGSLVAVFLAWVTGCIWSVFWRWRGIVRHSSVLHRGGLMALSGLIGGLFLVLLTANMGYYEYSHQYLDFVFFEYLDDLLAQGPGQAGQATLQTEAELDEGKRWGLKLASFLAIEGAVVLAWWAGFRRTGGLSLPWSSARASNLVVIVALLAGLTGLHPYGPWSIPRAGIGSSTYYLLSQNPIWYGSEALLGAFATGPGGTVSELVHLMPLDDAVGAARKALAPGATFPDQRYPLVHETSPGRWPAPKQRANVLLIFVEGLDRRYLGRAVDPGRGADLERWFIYHAPQFRQQDKRADATAEHIRLTPFLDRLREDSVFFSNFFANGTQTARGLFASFCSYYPRQGTAVMKTRYTLDYLCLPSVLRKSGYRTEMVIGQNRDRNFDHIGLFMARNGLQQLFDESDFPDGAEKLGLGMTDGALFDFLRNRIETLRRAGQPFFLTTLTVGTHHPYTVPTSHPEVRVLQRHADGYVAALRHLDLEFERFFTGLQRDGLLENTVVFILGDHGRHHGSGRSETERWAGHFMAPLFIWMDESLRTSEIYRPRTVSAVASQ